MRFFESLFDIVSGKRAHRNVTFGVSLASAFERCDRIGYASHVAKEAIVHADAFFASYLYQASAPLSINVKLINSHGAEKLIDLFVMAAILECCKLGAFRKNIALNEILQISADRDFAEQCLIEFNRSKLTPSDFFLKKVSDSKLIQGFENNIKAQYALREFARLELKHFSDSQTNFIEAISEAIDFCIRDLFPGNLQFIVDALFIEDAHCDVMLTHEFLLDWTEEKCAQIAANPKNAEDSRFSFYYWLREHNLGRTHVDPLPDEFREILIPDILQLLQEQKAIAFCKKCEDYAVDMNIEAEAIGNDGAFSIFKYKYCCARGHFLFSKKATMHLNIREKPLRT